MKRCQHWSAQALYSEPGVSVVALGMGFMPAILDPGMGMEKLR